MALVSSIDTKIALDEIMGVYGYIVSNISELIITFIFNVTCTRTTMKKGFYKDCCDILYQIHTLEIRKENKRKLYNSLFPYACMSGNIEIIDLMIARGARWNNHMGNMCRSGNIDLINFMSARDSYPNFINWDKSLYGACLSKNRNIISLVIGMLDSFENLNSGLQGACKAGDMELTKIIISMGADGYVNAFYCACSSGNRELANYLIGKIFNIHKLYINWNRALHNSCSSGNIELIEMIMSYGVNLNWNRGLAGACLTGKLSIAKTAISKGARNYNEALYLSCQSGNIKLVILIIRMGADDWDGGYIGACISGNIEIIDMMIKSGAILLTKGVEYAYNNGNIGAIQLLMDMGCISD